MAYINTTQEFHNYCLRRLGMPVISINVAPEQVEERVEDALQVFREKHFDGLEKEWVGYTLVQNDIDNGFITLPIDIHIVDKIIPMSSLNNSYGSDGIFSNKYQYQLKTMSPFKSLDTLSYYLAMTNLGEVDNLINTTERFEFVKHKNKLTVYNGFDSMSVGDVICIHVYKYIDPKTNPSVYNDKWFKQYATAMVKQQWGSNMKKHGEVQLLGGMTVNGQQIFDEATAELEKLEQELAESYQEPVEPLFG